MARDRYELYHGQQGIAQYTGRRRIVRYSRRSNRHRTEAPRLFAMVCAVGLWCGAGEAAEAPAPASSAIARLIRELEDDQFSTREASQRALIRLGRPVLGPLKLAASNGSPEIRRRARAILDKLHYGQHGYLTREFTRLASLPDSQFDLEEAMLLISQIVDPDVTKADLAGPLDELARAVQKRLGETPAKRADPRLVMEAFREELFVERGFRGNRENYSHPDNSSMAKVLATRQGLPILLSHVVVSVGQRLEVPIVGLGVPGVYMAKYEGSKAPGNFPKDDIIVNAFEGRVLSVEEFQKELTNRGEFDLKALLPSPRRKTVIRMLSNLSSHCDAIGDARLAVQVRQYQLLLDIDAAVDEQ